MNQFKLFFDKEITKSPDLFEMAYKTIPKDGKDWLIHMPQSVKNIICLASNPGPDVDIASIAKAYHWIMNWGLLEASRNRKIFTKKHVKPKIPDVKEVDVFSKYYRKTHPEVDWDELDVIWYRDYEPKQIDLGDKVIDIDAANQEIKKRRTEDYESVVEGLFNTFSFGGENGFMAYLETAEWERDRPDPRVLNSKLQGPDLSNARIESDVTGDFVKFYGLKNPNNMKIYTREVVNALRKSNFEEIESSKKILKKMQFSKGLGLDSTTSKIVPEDGEFDEEEYNKALEYFIKGLDHVKRKNGVGFDEREKEWIIAYVTMRYDGGWESWFKSDTKPQLKPVTERKLRGQFDIPFLKGSDRRNIKIANVINKGVSQISKEGYHLPIEMLDDLDYSKFAKKQKFVPVGTPSSLEKIHEEYVENGDWRWNISGKNMPPLDKNKIQLVKGNLKLIISKLANGLYEISKADENSYEPCGKNGCRVVMSGPLKLNTNSQEMRAASPLASDSETEKYLKLIFDHPELFGDSKSKDDFMLNSIKSASKHAGARINAYGDIKKIKDFDTSDFLSWGSIWLRDNLGNSNFLYGPMESALKLIDNDYLKNFRLNRGSLLQSNDPSRSDYMPPQILENLLKNGKNWRIHEMAKFFRSNLSSISSREKGYGTFGDMAGGEDGDQQYDAGDNSVHKLSDMARLATKGTQGRGRRYDPTIGGMVGVKVSDRLEAPQIVNTSSMKDLRISSLSKLLSPEEFEQFNSYYQRAYNAQSGRLDGSFNSWAEIVQLTTIYLTNAKNMYEKLGISDCVYDTLVPLFRNAVKNRDPDLVSNLSKISSVNIKSIYDSEKGANNLYNTELSDLSQKVKELSQAQSSAPTGVPMPQMPTSTAQQQSYSYNSSKKEEGMIRFNKWRVIKETEAIYDGTKPKDGCGFNWWGAVGRKAGTNIKGNPIRKKDKK